MTPIRPVLNEEMLPYETVYGEGQPDYNPLPALRSARNHGKILTRWRPTEEERKLIADGADIYLSVMTFHEKLQPVRVHLITTAEEVREEKNELGVVFT